MRSRRPRVGSRRGRSGSARAVAAALSEQYEQTRYRADTDLVFCHLALGTPLDPSKLSRTFMRPALKKAAITKPFRTWHDLRHTAITMSAAAGNPQAYVQMQAGHSSGAITERYVHAAAVMLPGAAAKTEERMFGGDSFVPSGARNRDFPQSYQRRHGWYERDRRIKDGLSS